VKREIETTSVEKWQMVWNSTKKGNTTKEFLPSVTERLNIYVSTNKHLTAIMIGRGNIKSYLHRFKIITSPTCPCGKNDQTTNHLIYECELLNIQSNTLKTTIAKPIDWPTGKNTLITKHYTAFKRFVNSIPFDNLS
jgi:hypothetical protein